jgi:hypothetical protein
MKENTEEYMKNKIFVISIGIFFILLFSGLNIPAKELLSSISISVFAVSDAEGNSDSETCPFLEGKNVTLCPYFNDNIEESNSSCPYLSGKEKCPYSGKEIQTPSCPFLNQDLKRDGNKDNIYKTIKKSST